MSLLEVTGILLNVLISMSNAVRGKGAISVVATTLKSLRSGTSKYML